MSAPRPFTGQWPIPFVRAIAICAEQGNEAAGRIREKLEARRARLTEAAALEADAALARLVAAGGSR